MNRAPLRGRAAALAAALTVLAVSLRALWLARDYALLGLDSLPLVLASRIGSPAELFERLAQPLFAGQLAAPYYRPVLHLSLAIDEWLFALEPFGYHASSVAVVALAAWALHALARGLGLGALGAFAAVAFFCLHPVQGVVIPSPARRADSLCLLFTLAAASAQLRATKEGRRSWLPAALALLAIGSKETGFAAPLLCGVAAVLGAREGSSRIRAFFAAAPPQLAVVGVAVLLRLAVLGSFSGGRPVLEAGELLARGPAMLLQVLAGCFSARAVWPDAALPGFGFGALLALGLCIAFAGAAAWQRMARACAPSALFAFAALGGYAAGYALGMVLQPWYLLAPVGAAALAVGASVHALDLARAEPGRAGRALAVVAGVCVALFVAELAIESPLVRDPGDWSRASVRMQRYLATAEERLAGAQAGQRVELPVPPAFIGGPRRMAGVVVLAPYTVKAWARLRFPETTVWVEGSAEEPETRPNVVLIIADDLGYADLGFQGSREIATPHLDRLAAEGVRFSDAYVSAPLCAPTRAGLLTGRDANRFGYTRATGTFQEQMRDDIGVPLEETLLPELLQRSGYATAAIGKWHLGARPQYRPQRRGFDSFFGILAGTHAYFDWGPGLYGPVFRGDERVQGDEYLTDAFAREAEAFLRREHDRPFFLYVAFHAVHAPFEAPERHLARYAQLEPEQRRLVAAMTGALDDGVGRILDALAAGGRDPDTLVVFLNDNGGVAPFSSNAPLRGGKASLFEGGIRVPFVVRWSGRVEAGEYRYPVSSLDVFPTVLAAAALSPDPGTELDGVDLLAHLGELRGAPAHESLRWRFAGGAAIRRGSWKLLRGPDAEPFGGEALFDLRTDPGETQDRSREHPGLAASLRRELAAWLEPPSEARSGAAGGATGGSPARAGSLRSPRRAR